ncbi:MAG: ABC transporter permease [Eubacteriales bacterium]|jgi:putative ABC transport system permease protein|nr:ABC transporter permease [Eubacteriales bacterium]MDD3289969.1 ABC transporter permease [Eubacteriales bacterium]MDD3863533.1 ABC transporter permease [Eubacteriales bacterium]MDD4444451.1 ABC transporter permease [Eubacteriales bacterium]
MDWNLFSGLVEVVLREGFIYGIMAMGVYITYKILDFPDLSVDGTFPLGACIAALLITAGVDPWLVCLAAFAAGACAGCVTGVLHVKLGITDLLSGILVMTAMWSVNLILTGGSAIKQFFNLDTIFNSGPVKLLPEGLFPHRQLIMVALIAVAVKYALDWYLSTKNGLLLRASGDNSQYVVNLARDPGSMKILGLAIGNGCTALAGCILAQLNQNADINSGKGMVVMALASVIIGISVFRRLGFFRFVTMAVLGSILYKACLMIALQLGLPNSYLKLLMAVLLTAAIVSEKVNRKGGKRIAKRS